MTDAIVKAITSMFLALSDRPWALIAVIFILIVGMTIKLALSNPKFWDILTGHLAQNTDLTKQTLEKVSLIADRQEVIKQKQEDHEDMLGKLTRDVSFLTEEVESLKDKKCENAPNCLNRREQAA